MDENFYEEKKAMDSFILINKTPKFSENFGFTDLSFNEIYKDDPLFSHIISHIKSELEKNDIPLKEKQLLEKLSEFIKKNQFTELLIENILTSGISDKITCLRPLIWKSLLGLFPLNSLFSWNEISKNKNEKYSEILKKYQNYIDNKITDENDINLISQIDKDLPRTRFEMNFFSEKSINNDKETNYQILKRLLFIHSKEHEDISYVQGMNEMIAIIYYIFALDDNPFMKNFIESHTYFCFEFLIDEIKPIFMMENVRYSQLFVTSLINVIKNIVNKLMPNLFNHFEEENLELDNVVMRWILALFSQEFDINKAVNFWDRMFTQKNKTKFICYMSAAIMKINEEKLLKMDLREIMMWGQELKNDLKDISIDDIVKVALYIQEKYQPKETNNIAIK